MLSKISSVMRQFRPWNGVMSFLVWPVTTDSCVRIFCHLRQMHVELFTLPNFVLSLPMKTTVSIYFTAAIVIHCGVLHTPKLLSLGST